MISLQVGSYSYEPNAFKFGDGPYSHSVVSLPRKLWQRNFNIQFDFRTFYPDGLLFASAVRNLYFKDISKGLIIV